MGTLSLGLVWGHPSPGSAPSSRVTPGCSREGSNTHWARGAAYGLAIPPHTPVTRIVVPAVFAALVQFCIFPKSWGTLRMGENVATVGVCFLNAALLFATTQGNLRATLQSAEHIQPPALRELRR